MKSALHNLKVFIKHEKIDRNGADKMDVISLMEKGLGKVSRMENTHSGFPHITKDGKWLTHENGHWTGGFWTGLLWMMSLYCQDTEKYLLKALQKAKQLKVRMNDNKTHDMGFIFGPSCVWGYNLTGDEELLNMAKAGAGNMIDLYEKKTGLVLAWDEPGYEGMAIVDTIMNVPLLVWVADQTRQPQMKETACHIADNILKHHIREDFSTFHVVRWDTHDFHIVEQTTHQGFSSTSCWSRGQAWALYGFANMYRYTSLDHYLETSEKLAQYFWEHLDNDLFLPRWDFVFQNQVEEPLDAAAGSIAASGMLLLSQMLAKSNQTQKSTLWRERAHMIVTSLTKHCLYADIDKYGIIEKATVDKPRNSGIGESTMYGDYYFMEALYRILNENNPNLTDMLY